MGLSKKQLSFISEYLIDKNGTRAAMAAGYSKKTANEQASRLLTNVNIQKAINEKLLLIQEKTEITVVRVLKEIFRNATSDFRQAFDENGKLKNIHDIPEDVARSIASVEIDELFDGVGKDRTQIGLTKKIKFWDKNKALEMLARHLELFKEKIEIDISENLAEKIRSARERILNVKK